MKKIVFAALSLLALPAVSPAFTPERLVYDVSWTGIKAGTAVQEVVREKDSVRIRSTARSADWLATFFKVDDRVESILPLQGEKTSPPLRYTMKIREGSTRRDREIVFDRAKGSATFTDHIKNKSAQVAVTPNTWDPLSSFYYVRTQKLEPGKSVFVDMLDNKKLWNIEVQVLRREKVKTPVGEFSTVVVKPLMKSEGIFNRKGDMFIWLTDDARHIPVKMQSKVTIGSIIATLVGGDFKR